jgi:hypothetical protein
MAGQRQVPPSTRNNGTPRFSFGEMGWKLLVKLDPNLISKHQVSKVEVLSAFRGIVETIPHSGINMQLFILNEVINVPQNMIIAYNGYHE